MWPSDWQKSYYCGLLIDWSPNCGLLIGWSPNCGLLIGLSPNCGHLIGCSTSCGLLIGWSLNCSLLIGWSTNCSLLIGWSPNCGLLIGLNCWVIDGPEPSHAAWLQGGGSGGDQSPERWLHPRGVPTCRNGHPLRLQLHQHRREWRLEQFLSPQTFSYIAR